MALNGNQKTANELFGVCGAAPIGMFDSTENTPVLQEHSFSQDMVILALAWMYAGAGQNLYLTGPTGSGKSSFIEQFCARIGMPAYVVACHGKLELNDLIGAWHLCEGGKKWVDGPAIRAMKEGSILLMDEVNFLDPSVVGGLNRILDGMPYYVPETNETVKPHDNFRVAMTSNPFDPKYKGVKKMNAALLDRMLAGVVDYMPAPEETKILNKAVPGIDGWIIEFIVNIANTVRSQFKEGSMETTISTRGLIRWGRMILMYGRSLQEAAAKDDRAKCCEILCLSLGQAVTNRSDPAEKSAIESIIQKTLK